MVILLPGLSGNTLTVLEKRYFPRITWIVAEIIFSPGYEFEASFRILPNQEVIEIIPNSNINWSEIFRYNTSLSRMLGMNQLSNPIKFDYKE